MPTAETLVLGLLAIWFAYLWGSEAKCIEVGCHARFAWFGSRCKRCFRFHHIYDRRRLAANGRAILGRAKR